MNENILLQIIPGTRRKKSDGISEKVLINMQNLLEKSRIKSVVLSTNGFIIEANL